MRGAIVDKLWSKSPLVRPTAPNPRIITYLPSCTAFKILSRRLFMIFKCSSAPNILAAFFPFSQVTNTGWSCNRNYINNCKGDSWKECFQKFEICHALLLFKRILEGTSDKNFYIRLIITNKCSSKFVVQVTPPNQPSWLNYIINRTISNFYVLSYLVAFFVNVVTPRHDSYQIKNKMLIMVIVRYFNKFVTITIYHPLYILLAGSS